MNFLKVVAPGFDGYTGQIGMFEFVDGVSVERLPRAVADRLSASIQMIELHEDGVEVEAGVAHRLVSESNLRAPVAEPLHVQTEAERAAEIREQALRGTSDPVERFYTGAELEAIIDKDGMKGLRVIADKWNVKAKAIPVLLGLVLQAQSRFLEARNARLAVLTPKVEETPVVEPEVEEDDETLLGSNVLASTYEIGGETVQLGDIVANAFALFGGTAEEWNALADDAREDLLRLELDRLLSAEPVEPTEPVEIVATPAAVSILEDLNLKAE